MVEPSPLAPPVRRAIVRQFNVTYAFLVSLLAGTSVALLAWHWSLPTSYSEAFPIGRATLILLGAALLINGLSFFVQNRYVQRVLNQPQLIEQFSVLGFAFRFYGYNLAIAVLFSLIGLYPWIVLFFVYAHYPIMLWLLPYHLLMGLLLGWLIKRRLPP